MISLKNLNLNNFMSHVRSTLDFTDYEGLVLIEGINKSGYYSSNGSGKSTLLEGIIYALTGDTLRGVSVNDVVNRNYKKNTKVSLTFKRDDSNYEVSRHRKDDTHGDSLLISKDGEDISKRVNKETQKLLEDILGISYKVLVSTTLLGEGLSSRFTQLSDPEKKNLIESTLNLNYDISAIRSKANTKISELKLEKSNIEGKISALEEMYSFDVEAEKRFLEENLKLEAEASKELAEMNSLLGNLKASREPLEKKLQIIYDSIYEYQTLLKEIENLDNASKALIDLITQVESSEDPSCPTCHQSLSAHGSKDAVISSYRKQIDDYQSQIDTRRTRMNSLPDIIIMQEKYNMLRDELANANLKIDELDKSISQKTNEYWSHKYRVDNSQKLLAQHVESSGNITALEEDRERIDKEIEKYDYFYRLFSPTGIIVNILTDAIEYINTRLSVYSNILLEKDYKINFIKGKISLVDSKGASYQSLSNGEKRRLDISIQFALHDYVAMYCGMKLDCCFIDEILDTLDDIGVENIFEVLRLKLEYCQLKSIYVITHNSALKSKFDRVITVSKDEKGDSYLI